MGNRARKRLECYPAEWHLLDKHSGSGSNIVGPPSADAKPKPTTLADYDEANNLPSEPARGATAVACTGDPRACPWCLLRATQQTQRKATAARARTPGKAPKTPNGRASTAGAGGTSAQRPAAKGRAAGALTPARETKQAEQTLDGWN